VQLARMHELTDDQRVFVSPPLSEETTEERFVLREKVPLAGGW
jgi:hypothetical protein